MAETTKLIPVDDLLMEWLNSNVRRENDIAQAIKRLSDALFRKQAGSRRGFPIYQTTFASPTALTAGAIRYHFFGDQSFFHTGLTWQTGSRLPVPGSFYGLSYAFMGDMTSLNNNLNVTLQIGSTGSFTDTPLKCIVTPSGVANTVSWVAGNNAVVHVNAGTLARLKVHNTATGASWNTGGFVIFFELD